MERVLEPEVMDGEAQSIAYANADFSEVDQAFADRFLSSFPGFDTGHLLDMGCGPAAITCLLCDKLHNIQVTGVDASEPMVALAENAIHEQRFSSRVNIVQGYFPGAISQGNQFDAVISNSLLHHLPDPMVLWHEIKRLVRANAPVLVVDLLRPDSQSRAQSIVAENASDEPEILKVDFYNSLLAAFEIAEIQEQLNTAGLRNLRCEQITDRHLAVWGRLTK